MLIRGSNALPSTALNQNPWQNIHIRYKTCAQRRKERLRCAAHGQRKGYRTLRQRSFISPGQTDNTGFKLAFDQLNIVVMEGRALRLFKACDLGNTGTIGISELEVALMIHDVVPTTSYMTPLDSFNVFDLDGGGDISWVEFKVRTRTTTAKQLFGACARRSCGSISLFLGANLLNGHATPEE